MNFKLIVISSPSSEPNETEAIISLFKAGLKIFHLRKPAMSEKKMNSFVSAVPKKYHSRMIIHSHYSLAKKYDLGGIHFSEKERNKNSERFNGKSTSTGFHFPFDVLCFAGYDSVFLSPVFDSISKRGYKGAIALNKINILIRNFKAHKGNKPALIALGGISEKNVLKIRNAGFDGAAFLGAIWLSKDPVKSFLRIRSKII